MLKSNKFTKINYLFYTMIILTIITIFLLFAPSDFQKSLERRISPGQNIPEQIRIPVYHAHVDFKVVLDNGELSFNKSKFDEANRYIHLHLNNPDGDKLIHIEGKENVTLGLFFESLGIKFNATCFVLDDGKSYCNKGDKRIRLFVNSKENFQFDFYELGDLNRILIVYGNETDGQIANLMNNVTDYACIYSNRCQERIAELPVPEEQLIF